TPVTVRNGRLLMPRSRLTSLFGILFCSALMYAQGPSDRERIVRKIMASAPERFAADATGPGGAFVGTEACLACHKMPNFRNTMHATGLKTVDSDAFSLKPRNGVIADYDKNGVDDFKQGLDFNKISSAFDKYKPNA